MNKEIEYLLNEMKDKECYYVGINGCLYQDLEKKEINLLLSYIEQLENNRDKAIEMLTYKQNAFSTCFSVCDVIDILKGDSDE